jgi:putative DNA primase/helicase
MGTAALQYARRGWKVFPCRERDGEPYTTANGTPKHPKAKQPYIGNGFKNATTDERQIRDWWKRWPQALIGFAIGESGYFALDFDPRHDPDSGEIFELKDLKAATEDQIGCALPVSLASMTQSDGVHVIYRQPREGEPIRNRGNLPRHVDVRGQGGYIILPPSILYREDGSEGRYRWIEGRRDTDPVEAPDALVEALRAPKGRANKPDTGGGTPTTPSSAPRSSASGAGAEAARKYAMSALDRELRDLKAAPTGDRNNQINARSFSLGQLVGAGALDETLVRGMLQQAVATFGRDYEKCCQSIENGLTAGMASPRDMREIMSRAEERASRPRRAASGAPAPPPKTTKEGNPPKREYGPAVAMTKGVRGVMPGR